MWFDLSFVGLYHNIKTMDKQEILEKLELCISIMESSENTFVSKRLIEVVEALKSEWSNSYDYEYEIKQVLNYDNNLNKIW